METNKRQEIDIILRKMSSINAALGIDSTKEEKRIAKHECEELMKQIKLIDKTFFKEIEEDK